MSRVLKRTELTLSGTTFDSFAVVPAAHKWEAVAMSVFDVATSGTIYFGIQPAVGGFLFLDQLDKLAGRYVEAHQYSGYVANAGDRFQVAFSGTGFVAASASLAYVDVTPV